MINDSECNDPDTIAKEVFKFYSNLYSSKYSPSDPDSFFEKIKHLIPSIDSDFKELCESN